MTTDLLLINPSDHKTYGRVSKFSAVEPPLWATLIAAYVRIKGYNIKIIDANAEGLSIKDVVNRIIETNPLLTGIVVMGQNPSASSTPKMIPTKELLEELYKRKNDDDFNGSIFLCGLHPSSLPEKTLKEEKIDFVVQGEGFQTILQLLEMIKSGNYKIIKGLWHRIKLFEEHDSKFQYDGPPESISNLDNLPLPAWDLLDMTKYRSHIWHSFNDLEHRSPYGIIYTSLGCPFNCTYCNVKTLYGKVGIRYRNPEKVVNDIDTLVEKYGIRKIKIIDELFAINEKRVIDICDRIIKKNYKPLLDMWAYSRVDSVTKSMLIKMKQAGITWICYGFESANEEVRKGVNKKFESGDIKNVVKMTHDIGINILGNFLFGLPDDDYTSMNQTLNLAKELNCDYVNFYATVAYPGSQLYYDTLISSPIQLVDNWDVYNQYSPNFKPLSTKYLSSEQVLEFRDKAFKEYYTRNSYLNMIKNKFGQKTVDIIKEMINIDIRNKENKN